MMAQWPFLTFLLLVSQLFLNRLLMGLLLVDAPTVPEEHRPG